MKRLTTRTKLLYGFGFSAQGIKDGLFQLFLFFSTMSFAYKCTIGLGSFIAGILLTWISFPKQTDASDVPPEAIMGLGYIGGPILMIIYFSAIIFIILYPITKGRYAEIRAGLENDS